MAAIRYKWGVLRTAAGLAVLALALPGCEGDDDDEAGARQAVRDFVEATNEHDGERLCGELVTEGFKERATGATGGRVDEVCERQLELTTGLEVKLLHVGRTRVQGDQATVQTRLDIDGVRAPRVFRLEKEDGAWKLASGSSG